MPPRTIQTVGPTADPAQLARHVVQLAGLFDDPIASVRVSMGPILSGPPQAQRDITLQVVDRLADPYPGRAFTDKRGRKAGRWLIWVYFSSTEFGAPEYPYIGPSVEAGRMIDNGGTSGTLYLVQTDATGLCRLRLNWDPANLWVHCGVPVLLRVSKLAAWQTAAEGGSDSDAQAGDAGAADTPPGSSSVAS